MHSTASRLRHIRNIACAVMSAAVAILVGQAASAYAQVGVTVGGTMNIYGAGHLTAPGPCGNGGGILPFEISIPPGTGRSVQLSLSGTLDFGPCCPTNGPDGISYPGALPLPQYDGLAGCDLPNRARGILGVFLDDSEPMAPRPDSLVIADITFTDLSPGLRQIFFVGDGLTGTGAGDAQTFYIPDDATRLFIGISDRCSALTPNQPGYYSDNSGTVTGTATFVVTTGVDTRTPKGFQLEGNFPNPFSSHTTLTFSVASPIVVSLGVYDIRGRLVRLLLHESVEGLRSVLWDGRNADGNLAPSGIYYYRLQSGDASVSRKMLLLR